VKSRFALVILTVMVLMLTLTCRTYQIGAAFEARENSLSTGVAVSFDINSYLENSVSFFSEMYPESSNLSAIAFGYDFDFKYPFNVYEFYSFDGRILLFPIIGADFRVLFATLDNSSETSLPQKEKNQPMGLGFKIGGGFDIYISDYFFVRGKVYYQPEFLSIGNSYSGIRFNINVGWNPDYWW